MQRFEHVATTGLSEVWYDHPKRRFLSNACFLPDNIEHFCKERSSVLVTQTGFDVRSKHLARARYISKKFEKFLVRELLSHHQFGSERYWRIIVSRWICDGTTRHLFKIWHLREAEKSNRYLWPVFDEAALCPPPNQCLSGYGKRHLKALLHYARFAQELKLETEPVEITPELQSRVFKPSPFASSEISGTHVKPNTIAVMGWMHIQDDVLQAITPPHLSSDLTTFQKPSWDDDYNFEALSPNRELREKFLCFQPDTLEEMIIFKLLVTELPTHWFEGFSEFRSFALSKFERIPKLLISALGWHESEVIRFVAAEATLQGGRLLGYHHGAIYGIYHTLSNREIEQEMADTILTWGWTSDQDSNAVNMPCLQTSACAQYKANEVETNKRDKILVIVNQIISYPEDCRSALKSGGTEQYIIDMITFLDNLPPIVRKRVRIRFKHDRDQIVWNWLKSRYPEIEVENRDVPFNQSLVDVELVYCDCCTQVYTEALCLRPTILMWNSDIWLTHKRVTSFLHDLEQVGILHRSPLNAAKAVVEIVESGASQWWHLANKRKAVSRFLNKFARPDKNWVNYWQRKIANEVDAAIRRSRTGSPNIGAISPRNTSK